MYKGPGCTTKLGHDIPQIILRQENHSTMADITTWARNYFGKPLLKYYDPQQHSQINLKLCYTKKETLN